MSLVRSGAVGGYEKLVKRLGRNPVELMAQVGLSPAGYEFVTLRVRIPAIVGATAYRSRAPPA